MDKDLEIITAELDQFHRDSREAFLARDLVRYESLFTADLQYVQPNGKPIGRPQLMRDVARQLAEFKNVDVRFERESIFKNADGTVTQILHQSGVYKISVFFFFTKHWNVRRIGKYTYRKTDDGWRIARVEVISETVK